MITLTKIKTLELTWPQQFRFNFYNSIVRFLKYSFNHIAGIRKHTITWNNINMESTDDIKWMKFTRISSFIYANLISCTIKIFNIVRENTGTDFTITPNDIIGYNVKKKEVVAKVNQNSKNGYVRLGNLYSDDNKEYRKILKYVAYHKSFTEWYLFYGSLRNWSFFNKQQYMLEHIQNIIEAYIATIYKLESGLSIFFDPLSGEAFTAKLSSPNAFPTFDSMLDYIYGGGVLQPSDQEEDKLKIIKFDEEPENE